MRETTAFPSDIEACHQLLREQSIAIHQQGVVITECRTAITEREAVISEREAVITEREAVIAERDAALAAKDALVAQQNQQLIEQKEKIAEYQLRLAAALQAAFRKRIERYLPDPNQLTIDFGNSPDVADAAEGIADAAFENIGGYRRRQQQRAPARSEQLPAHLPRIEVILPVPEDQKICPEHGEREIIGHDWQETLKIEPPKLVVVRTGIPKLACKKHDECGVVEAPRPVGLVEGNRYDTSVAAQIVTHKYSYHLPIYRQQDVFAACGWTPARSTLLNILRAAAECIAGFVTHLREVVRAGPIIGTDDTTVTLLTPKDLPPLDPLDPKSARTREVIAAAHAEARKSITARMWAYRGITVPINVFDFTVSSHRDGPELFLDTFTGKLMADCYSGYDAVQTASDGRIVRAACVAHARRKVFNARANHPTHAAMLLSMFQRLYDIEDRAKTCSAADRQGLRQAEAKPIWEQMREYINGQAVHDVLPKDSFGQALTYLRNQFEPLLVYLDDGVMPIDNNETEQLMKQVAIGRKNWLFIGDVGPGYRAADLLTLVSSAVRNDLDVFAYVKEVLDRLLAGETDYEALRPDVWKLTHPEAVRQYRVEERTARADAKAKKRARRRAARK
jgi:transposase